MNNQKILDNAPEGATHVDNNGYYLKAGRGGFMEPSDCGVDWDYDYANHTEVRSLVDIAKIAELEKALKSTNAELSGAIDQVNHFFEYHHPSNSLDEPERWDKQTCFENQVLLKEQGK